MGDHKYTGAHCPMLLLSSHDHATCITQTFSTIYVLYLPMIKYFFELDLVIATKSCNNSIFQFLVHSQCLGDEAL